MRDFHLVPLEARPGPLENTQYLETEVLVCANSPKQLHTLHRLFVYSAG